MELKFNDQGLIPVIVRDQEGEVLMLAYMNQEALDRTLATDTPGSTAAAGSACGRKARAQATGSG